MEIRTEGSFGNGVSDGFEPLEPLDLESVKTVDDLVRGMAKTSFGGRLVGEAADVLEAMVTDKDCFVVGTFSGAMTIAKMGLLICDMIDRGMIDAIVTTGALVGHGVVEGAGMKHFKYRSGKMKDEELYYKGYDRVYDTLELENNLDLLEKKVIGKLIPTLDENEIWCSHKLCREIGRFLVENFPKGRGMLKSAFQHNVPVYIPAFTDCELGLDFALAQRRREKEGKKRLLFDPFLDLEDYTSRIMKSTKDGIFTVGGGVPRNWAQQVAPYLDIINARKVSNVPARNFIYGVRICPEPVHWGGLSGCTYSEGVSWGKFVSPSKGGRFAEVLEDATVAWPLMLKSVIERLERKGIKRIEKPWREPNKI